MFKKFRSNIVSTLKLKVQPVTKWSRVTDWGLYLRGVTVTANAVMIPLDHVLVSRSNGYGLRTNCSGQDSSKRRIATTQNFCPTIAVSAVTITVSVVTIQVYFSP